MPPPASPDYQRLRRAFEHAGQGHVFRFWNELDDRQRAELLSDLARVNLAELPALARLAAGGDAPAHAAASLEPPRMLSRASLSPGVAARGAALISQGTVGALTVAGGLGTRLGFDGPKGAFPISPVRRKTLFQLFAEQILATERRYGCSCRWYIMTSPANDRPTRAFFATSGHFGLQPDRVLFFVQGVVPAFDATGQALLAEKHRLALSPDGHGGTLLALATSGMLADMKRHGIEYISYFQVDNPLVYCLDPVFLGAHDLHGADMSGKTVPKVDDFERVGNFALCDGRLTVIEYSDLPEDLARARNADGARRFDAANIAIHVISRTFVERLTADPAVFALPWHRTRKKVPCIDLETGRPAETNEPNAVKLETFIFDALPLARNAILLETSRAEEFSPVKNATGVDSVETARRDQSRRAARWLDSAGWRIPRDASGEPDGRFEISPLAALDADQLRAAAPAPRPLAPGVEFYLE